MNRKKIICILLFLVVIIGAWVANYSYAEPNDNGENTVEKFDATININFLNHDDSQWEFEDYDNLLELEAYDALGNLLSGLNYEYLWSNGANGSGTTGVDGKISFKPSDVSASTSVELSFKDCTQRFIIKVPEINRNILSNQNVYSNEYNTGAISMMYGWKSGGYIGIDKTGFANIDLYKVTPPATINIKFLHEDGSEWFLDGDIQTPALKIFNNIGHFEYEGYCNNDYNFENDMSNVYFANNGEDEEEKLSGCSEIKLIVYNVEEQTKLGIDKYDIKEFSKVCINGMEHEFVEKISDPHEEIIDLKPGETVNLEYYLPETATGTLGIDSYDGSLSEGFVWNLHFDMVDGESSNEDYNNVYWTFEGDDTKYRPTKKSGEYGFDIQIPFGKKVTLHNLPVHAMFHNAESFNNNKLSAGNKISSWTQSAFSEKTVVTYKGENITSELVEQIGAPDGAETYYTYKTGDNDEPIDIDSSGYLKDFKIKDGFEINWYVFRNQTHIMFQKKYEDEIDLEEKDKKFHFRVKLIDSWTQKPLAGKVAYYIYSNDEEVVDIEKDVKYATLDSEGYMDIYIKAGEYARIGKTITDEEISAKKLRTSNLDKDEMYITSNKDSLISWQYFNDLGMLPYGVEYTIEEVEDDYSVVVEDTYNTVDEKDNVVNGTSKHMYGGEYNRVEENAKYHYVYLDGFRFINNRKIGSLTLQKIVIGQETDEKFKFNVKIKDSAEKFPLEYEYVNKEGNTGKIKFEVGEKIIEDDIEYTEYQATIELGAGQKIIINGLPAGAKYEVTEDAESAKGYESQMICATGEIKAEDNEERTIVSCINKEIVEEDIKPEIDDEEIKPEEEKQEEIKKEEEKQEETKQEESKTPGTGDTINFVVTAVFASAILLGIAGGIIIKENKE